MDKIIIDSKEYIEVWKSDDGSHEFRVVRKMQDVWACDVIAPFTDFQMKFMHLHKEVVETSAVLVEPKDKVLNKS